jgi:hypothetical protein
LTSIEHLIGWEVLTSSTTDDAGVSAGLICWELSTEL